MAHQSARCEICDDPAEWDAFVRRSPQGSVFVSDALLRCLPYRCERMVWRTDAHILAAVPIFCDSEGQPLRVPPTFLPNQGLLVDASRGRKRHTRLVQDYTVAAEFLSALADRFSGFSLSNSCWLEDLRPFLWHNHDDPDDTRFHLQLKYTGLIDLQEVPGFPAFLETINRRRRNEWKGKNKAFDIRETDDVGRFLDLHDRTLQFHGVAPPPADIDPRGAVIRAGLEQGFGRLVTASDSEGHPASMVFWAYDEQSAYHLFAANERPVISAGASTVLLLHLIRDAFDRGLERVDLCGVNAPGFGEYKISFNCNLVPYFVTTLR